MTKQILPQSETAHKSLQSFASKKRMNMDVNAHKRDNDLSQTEKDILDSISRYACKVFGVCHLSKAKIAADAGYKDRGTAIKACNRLEALGIIEQHETRRVRGDRRRSSNIIVITAIKADDQKVDNHTEPTAETNSVEPSLKASSSSNTLLETTNQVSTNKPSTNQPLEIKDSKDEQQTLTTDEIIKRGLKNSIPTAIYSALEPFFDGQTMYDTYGIMLRAKAKVGRHIRIEDHVEKYVNAFYNVIRLHKEGKVRSLSNILYVTWENLTMDISRLIGMAKPRPTFYYNWLEDDGTEGDQLFVK